MFQLKESKQAVNSIRRLVEEDDDEEDVEKISWSGEPVGSEFIIIINTCGQFWAWLSQLSLLL